MPGGGVDSAGWSTSFAVKGVDKRLSAATVLATNRRGSVAAGVDLELEFDVRMQEASSVRGESIGSRIVLSKPLPHRRAGRWMLWLLLSLSLALIMGAAAVGWLALTDDAFPDPAGASAGAQAKTSQNASLSPPAVDPVQYMDVSPEDARTINAAVTFADRLNPPASSYRLISNAETLLRAVDCLSAAAWYEAGDDAVGEAAVIQVVLNRVRHPSFPKSICGVVFQGSDRPTGCQFSFACDGAMRRIPAASAWQRARALALSGLTGQVFRAVGWSTHYHTDWVVPYWSRTVDKTAKVGTHLFFRWRGRSGDAAAFSSRYAGSEPIVPMLAGLSAAHKGVTLDVPEKAAAPLDGLSGNGTAATPGKSPTPPVPAEALRGSTLLARDETDNQFAVLVKPDGFAGDLAVMAIGLCGIDPAHVCTVVGQLDASGPSTDFYYMIDRRRGVERILWNCLRFPRSNARQCMPASFKPE